MADIPINDIEPIDFYTAAGGELSFDYNFPIFKSGDLVVLQITDLGVVSTLVEVTDYTVSGVGLADGGTMTFDVTAFPSGAPADYRFVLYRDLPVSRITDFLTGGDFKALTVNKELDSIIMMIQQNELELKRSLSLLKADVEDELKFEIETAAERTGRALVFGAAGNSVLAGPTTQEIEDAASEAADAAVSAAAALVSENAAAADAVSTAADAVSTDADATAAAASETNAAASAAAADVAKIEWQGTYNAGTAYALNDAVTLSGSSFINIQAGTGNTPAVGGTAFWDDLANKGDAGGGLGNVVEDVTPQLGGALDTNSFSINESEGAAVVAATTTDIFGGDDGNTIHITGNTQIDDFTDASSVGQWRRIIFDGTPQLTSGSGITVAGGTQTMAAGDMALVYADAVDAFTAFILKADGTPVVGGGAWSVKQSGTLSAATELAITGVTKTTRIFTDLTVSDDGTFISLQTSATGGAPYDSSAANYLYATSWNEQAGTTTPTGIAGSLTAFSPSPNTGVGNAAGESNSSEWTIYDPASAANKTLINCSMREVQTDGVVVRVSTDGMRDSAAAVTAVRIFPRAGTTFSGPFVVLELN